MTSTLPRTVKLRNGVELPRVGLGTFRSQGADVKTAVIAALKHNIRHIDTASIYKNEEAIAEAIRDSGVPRKDIFITSKVSPYQQGAAKARVACDEILQRLRTDYVDLVLIHWPGVSKTDPTSPKNADLRWETWCVLQEYYNQGKFRAIGVSNYEVHHLRELMQRRPEVVPHVNQVEVHPLYPNVALRQACKELGVEVVAYASLGTGELLKHPTVGRIADEASKTPAQVLLRWALQNGLSVIPKSVRPERVQQATEYELLQGWQLSEHAMAELDGLTTHSGGEQPRKFCWDPVGIV